MKSILTLAIVVTGMFSFFGMAQKREIRVVPQHRFVPKGGFVPDEQTARAIAEAVLIPIYGREKIESERPFQSKLESGTWVVEGSLSEGKDGGVATVKLLQSDGRILSVIHGK